MLTSIPPAVLHWLRDKAREVVALAELGLALTCPCGGDHGNGPALLGHDDPEPCPDDPAHQLDSHAPGGAWYGAGHDGRPSPWPVAQ